MDAKTFLGERVPLFSGVSDERLTELALSSTLLTLKKGQTVLFQGATVDALHVVAVGKVGILAKVPGKGVVQVAELGSGEVFGEASIVEMGTARATVKVLEDGTLVLAIPQEGLRRLLASDAAFAARVKALIDARKAG